MQRFLPVLCDASWVDARAYALKNCLVSQQRCHALEFEVIRIKSMQCGGKLDSQFRRVQNIAIKNNQIDAVAELTGKVS